MKIGNGSGGLIGPRQLSEFPTPFRLPLVGQWYSIDITDLYNAWQNGTHPNHGLQLRPVRNDNR